MNTEQKARAYDEALEKARKYHAAAKSINDPSTARYENIFPELCESEDEKTRKRLIDFISNIKTISESGRNSLAIRKDDAEMCDAFLLYLEKKKDHFRDDTKMVELQDYSGLNDLERAIHRGFLSAGVENVPVAIIKETANECKRIANENANAEWNEDDESFYDSIMCEVIKEGMHPTPAQANWLKSLPERFNLQPKQEWSEEDEQRIAEIEFAVMQMNTKRVDTKDKCLAWLKSLRPVSKESLQPHWNPSKEQMDALKNVAYGTYQNGNGPALRSLYEQLKKLGVKEEPEYYQHFDPDC